MVKIPKDHPVWMSIDWVKKRWITKMNFKPFCKIEQELKSRIAITDLLPELVLGERLPDSCIKYTKDIKLLNRGNTKKTY